MCRCFFFSFSPFFEKFAVSEFWGVLTSTLCSLKHYPCVDLYFSGFVVLFCPAASLCYGLVTPFMPLGSSRPCHIFSSHIYVTGLYQWSSRSLTFLLHHSSEQLRVLKPPPPPPNRAAMKTDRLAAARESFQTKSTSLFTSFTGRAADRIFPGYFLFCDLIEPRYGAARYFL